MTEFVQALGAIAGFLLPVGIYCLVLASINRQPRPVMASGAWDTIGLLFAVSGFLLITMPILFAEFYRRSTGIPTDVIAIWLSYWAIWVGYFSVLVIASVLMVLWCGAKTTIYNVDLEKFPEALDRTLATLGLETHRGASHLTLSPAPARPHDVNVSTAIADGPPRPANAGADHRHADLRGKLSRDVQCHAALGRRAPGVREEIERELERNLDSAAPLENPAAGWFLSVSGMILGAVTAVILAIVFLIIMTTR